jgi:hypothetical protein
MALSNVTNTFEGLVGSANRVERFSVLLLLSFVGGRRPARVRAKGCMPC